MVMIMKQETLRQFAEYMMMPELRWQHPAGKYLLVFSTNCREKNGFGSISFKCTGPSTEAPSTKEENVLLITGGVAVGAVLSSVEVYPNTHNCSPPPLPVVRSFHATFLTSEPNPVLATCGGRVGGEGITASCIVLDKSNDRWDESRMGNLTMPRYASAAISLNFLGVFMIGGYTVNNKRTSDFLAAGRMEWQHGPPLPLHMLHPCAVTITPSSFLVFAETNIREFDADIAGPMSSMGWREAGRWPRLKVWRGRWSGCAKLGPKVIVAGGYGNGGSLKSTEVVDLKSRRISSGGNLVTPRYWFHIAPIVRKGFEKVIAFGGLDGWSVVDTVEEWVEESSTWKEVNSLSKERSYFGATVVLNRENICPT